MRLSAASTVLALLPTGDKCICHRKGWQGLANTIQQSTCDGDAAFHQITLNTCYYHHHHHPVPYHRFIIAAGWAGAWCGVRLQYAILDQALQCTTAVMDTTFPVFTARPTGNGLKLTRRKPLVVQLDTSATPTFNAQHRLVYIYIYNVKLRIEAPGFTSTSESDPHLVCGAGVYPGPGLYPKFYGILTNNSTQLNKL